MTEPQQIPATYLNTATTSYDKYTLKHFNTYIQQDDPESTDTVVKPGGLSSNVERHMAREHPFSKAFCTLCFAACVCKQVHNQTTFKSTVSILQDSYKIFETYLWRITGSDFSGSM